MRDMSEAEFDAALAQYGDTVYRLAFAYTRNRADADDVFQEVFLRYFRRAPAFETEEHRKAWLLRVTINRAKSCLSKMLHEPQETADAAPFSAPESLELHEALLRLAPKYRTVIHLLLRGLHRRGDRRAAAPKAVDGAHTAHTCAQPPRRPSSGRSLT